MQSLERAKPTSTHAGHEGQAAGSKCRIDKHISAWKREAAWILCVAFIICLGPAACFKLWLPGRLEAALGVLHVQHTPD